MVKAILFLISFLLVIVPASAQRKNATRSFFRDSTDGAFDVSEWVLTAHGFIPIPMLITEPALGNFGGALIPVFITRNAPYLDSVGGKLVTQQVRPNIYAGVGAYTANGTWLGAGLAMGAIKKWRAYYRVASGYANVNLNFYKALSSLGDQSFLFTIKTVPVYGQLIKQISRSHWYVGANYLYLRSQIERGNPIFYQPEE